MDAGISVVLLNLGGPTCIEEVRPFLLRLFSDREIIHLPLQPLLARLIVFFRLRKVLNNYRRIGGGSPLLKISRAQAEALEQRLRSGGTPVSVHLAMRYMAPTARDAVREVLKTGNRSILALPLYPHYSSATTGSSLRDLERTLKEQKEEFRMVPIQSFCDHPGYLDALSGKVRRGLESFSSELRDQVEIIFSAHALPQRMIDRGDPYLNEIRKTVQGVLQRIGPVPHHLAFQSRSGPVRWMRPGTGEMIARLAEAGKKALLMVPVSFVSDHIETLFEIDQLYKEQALSRGIVEYRRTESLNTDPGFISALADLTVQRISTFSRR